MTAQIFIRSFSIAKLPLKGLTDSRKCADRNRATGFIGSKDIADQKVSAVELIEIFPHRQSGEKVAPSAFFLPIAEALIRVVEDLVGRARAESMDDIVFHPGHRQRLANWTTPLTDEAFKFHPTLEGKRDSTPFQALSLTKNK